MRKQKELDEEVKIEKLVFGGQGMGRLADGRVVFVWNALPGEIVKVTIIKRKKEYVEAIATTIVQPSPERVDPLAPQYLSTSAWQILSWERENYWKKAIAAETYGKVGGLIFGENIPKIVTDDVQYEYRNKIEFSFCELDDGELSLAFFARGGKSRIPVEKSLLAEPIINKVANEILTWVKTQNLILRNLKSVIIRSNGEGKAIAALFIKDELVLNNFPKTSEYLLGFHVYYSTHKSPASVPTKLLHSDGQDYLIANLKSTKLKFGLHSFFQVNINVFDECLTDIAMHLDPKAPLLDFYSGVGAIGLPLSHNREKTILVDSNKQAIAYAKDNIKLNNRNNCEAHCAPAEEITELISGDMQLIVDPPRAGLHKNVLHKIIAKKPPKIIYLSCNLSTQARDIRMLEEYYKITFIKLYNFFPRTPHIEGLIVLERM